VIEICKIIKFIIPYAKSPMLRSVKIYLGMDLNNKREITNLKFI